LHTHPSLNGQPPNINPSGADKFIAEVLNKPFYVVTASAINAYVPQYGGDISKILENIGPEINKNAYDWLKYYGWVK
jgi:hypothetical protein